MLPYDYKVKMIKLAIDEIDPMGLLSLDCPEDEYLQEAKLLADRIILKRLNVIDERLIDHIFYKQFGEKLSSKVVKELSIKIARYLNMKTIIEELESSELIKDKLTISNGEVVVKIHNRFIVKFSNCKLYINDKFYEKVEENNLLNILINLITNENIIYVQYFHRGLKGYFRSYKRSEYNYDEVRKQYDIEYVFDNEELLDFSGLKNVSEEEIINIMYNEEIEENYEKVFYSKNKKKRVIIYKNDINSYSYYVEKLTIVDLEERQWYGKYAIWESDNCGQLSLYQSMECLLKDINYILYDMEEKNCDC